MSGAENGPAGREQRRPGRSYHGACAHDAIFSPSFHASKLSLTFSIQPGSASFPTHSLLYLLNKHVLMVVMYQALCVALPLQITGQSCTPKNRLVHQKTRGIQCGKDTRAVPRQHQAGSSARWREAAAWEASEPG